MRAFRTGRCCNAMLLISNADISSFHLSGVGGSLWLRSLLCESVHILDHWEHFSFNVSSLTKHANV